MPIPDEVLRRAALVLFDDLAAIVSARGDPVLSGLTDRVLADGGKPLCTVFRGDGTRTDRYSAALANGAAAPWSELDGGSRRVPCHAGTYSIPALLAQAEAERLSMRETLRCLVVAYEVVTRIALAFAQPSLDLHPHALFTAIGAAAATSAARHLDATRFFDALTLASTLISPGPFDHAVRGSLARNLWVGTGSWAGMRAADWAGCGIAGLPEGPRQIFAGFFGTECIPERLTDDLGSDWQIMHGFQKIYPCCQYAHSTIEAIESVLRELPPNLEPRDCEEIFIEIHRNGRLLDERRPPTILSARFSIPHIAAVAVIHGRVDTESLDVASLEDEAIGAMRSRVVMAPYAPERAPPNDRAARVTLVFPGGHRFRAECLCARGSPKMPFEIETIRRKVNGICRDAYPGMLSAMDRLVALDPQLLDSTWDALVVQIGRQTALNPDQ